MTKAFCSRLYCIQLFLHCVKSRHCMTNALVPGSTIYTSIPSSIGSTIPSCFCTEDKKPCSRAPLYSAVFALNKEQNKNLQSGSRAPLALPSCIGSTISSRFLFVHYTYDKSLLFPGSTVYPGVFALCKKQALCDQSLGSTSYTQLY